MTSLRQEKVKKKMKDNKTKDVRNLFRLKKQIDDTTIENIRNVFRLKKEKMKQSKTE